MKIMRIGAAAPQRKFFSADSGVDLGRRLAAFAALALLVAGCASGGPILGGRVNYAAGSSMAHGLGGRELDTLSEAFIKAVESGAPGEPVVWSAGSYSGSVTPLAYLVGNLKPNPSILLPVEGRLELGKTFETEQGPHVTTGKANLRSGPSTKASVLDMLEGGTAVDGVGKIVGEPWMLVAIDGVIRGYVHQSLLIQAPGTELELAGGPARRAHFCRAFQQTLTYFGETDRWQGAACDRGAGWRLEPVPPPPVL